MATNWPASKDTTTTLGVNKTNTNAVVNTAKEFDADNVNNQRDATIGVQTSLGEEGTDLSSTIGTATTTDIGAVRYRLEGRMMSRYGASEPTTIQRILTEDTLANASTILLDIGHTATTMDAFVSLFQVKYDGSAKGYIQAIHGGTGQVLYAEGDLLYASSTTALSKLPIGTAGQVLTVNGGATAPEWATGITAPMTLTVDDATANATSTVLSLVHTTSGTPANSLGARLLYRLENSTPATADAGAIDCVWTDVTAASEDAELELHVMGGGTLRKAFQLSANGSTATLRTGHATAYLSAAGQTNTRYEYAVSSHKFYVSGAAQVTIDSGGFLKPAGNATANISTSALSWSIGYIRTITGNEADGASAVGVILNTHNTFSTAGALLVSERNNGTQKGNLNYLGGRGQVYLLGLSSAPTIAAGTGAGTTPTVSVAGNDISGVITVTTGTSCPAALDDVATITLNVTRAAAMAGVVLTPANEQAANLAGTSKVWADVASYATNQFLIYVSSGGLTDSTTYKWSYVIV